MQKLSLCFSYANSQYFFYCSIEYLEDISKRGLSTVKTRRNGLVYLTTIGKYTTFCALNLKYFPFDRQNCILTFMHTVRIEYDIKETPFCDYFAREGIKFIPEVEVLPKNVLAENEEWEVLNLTLQTQPFEVSFDEMKKVVYPTFRVVFELQRKSTFYALILMVPILLVASISVIGFLLPSESGEKVSLQLTSLLSYVLLLLVVVDIVPPVGGTFPIIGKTRFLLLHIYSNYIFKLKFIS